MRRLLKVGALLIVLVAAWWVVFDQRGDRFADLFSGPSFLRAPAQAQTGAAASARTDSARTAEPRKGFPIETATVRAGDALNDIRTVGSLQSDESVLISSEIAGRVAEISFAEGQHVEAGDMLVRLDSALTQAEIDEVRARLALAEANHRRTSQLAKGGNATQRANDEAVAEFATARAALALVEARFDKLSIRAPFPGVLGVRKVSVGAYLNPGVEIVNLEKIDQLKVDFKVPETYLARVRVGQPVELTVDALPGERFSGTIYAIDPMVDVNGRALRIRARLPNPDLALRPGLFARIAIKNTEAQQTVFVPEEAIVPRGDATFVYRVADGKVFETEVKLGARLAGEVEVLEGLAAGAQIVTAGQHRLSDGAPIEVAASAAGGQI
ncbi:efflux RND transporter periplasmic adaptor subunit [Pseudochelatococcus sp. B33]